MQPPLHDSLRSLERVYREHLTYVWWTLRALGVVESAIDDAAQDVFVVVHRRLGEFEGRASMKTWLYQIARRVAMHYRRKFATDAARTFELPELGAVDDLEAAVDRATAAEVLQSFIATLDEDRRRVFVLAELGEMRGREIAEALNVNPNTVYARLRSARTDLDRMAHRLRAKDASGVVRSVRERRPSNETRRRTWLALAAKLPIDAVAITAGTGVAAIGTLGWGLVGAVAGAVLLVTVAAVVSPPNRPASDPVHVASPPKEVVIPAPSVAGAGEEDGNVGDPLQVARRSADDPAVDEVAGTMPDTATPDPGKEETAARPRSRPRTPSLPPQPPAKPTLRDELDRVTTIRRAVLGADQAAAEAAIAAYHREFSEGALQLEVDAMNVEIACRVSADDAAARLRRFRRKRPDSRLTARLEKTCAGKIGPQKEPAADTVPP